MARRANELGNPKLTRRTGSMSRFPRNGASKKLIGRNLAAYLIVLEGIKNLPAAERRQLVRQALAALPEDTLARQSEAVFEEARQTLIRLLKK